MKKRFSEEQVIGILAEADSGTGTIRDVCRRHNITEQTFFRWRNKYGGLGVSEVRRLKELELENARLKKIVAEQAMAIDEIDTRGTPNMWTTSWPAALHPCRA